MANINCKCESNLTCRYCLQNAKPYFFTPSTFGEIVARERTRWATESEAKKVFESGKIFLDKLK